MGSILALLIASAQAASITITDTCPSYTVSTQSAGNVSIVCATATTPPPTTPPTTPPLPEGSITCEGFTKTVVVPLTWSKSQQTVIVPPITTTEVIVGRFTTPSVVGTGGWVAVSINVANSAGFVGSFDTVPCTFTKNVKSGTLSASWQFGSTLKPNTQYFLNVKGDSELWLKLQGR
jgi:hypothetical protein